MEEDEVVVDLTEVVAVEVEEEEAMGSPNGVVRLMEGKEEMTMEVVDSLPITWQYHPTNVDLLSGKVRLE